MSWRDLPGWFDFQDVYDQAVAEAGPGEALIEVGVAFGKSLAYLTERARAAGKGLQVIGVDSFPEAFTGGPVGSRERDLVLEHGGIYGAFQALMQRHAPEAFRAAIVIRGESTAVARDIGRQILPAVPPIGFVFLDGDHTYEAVKADLFAWTGLVRPGGVIAGHDHTRDFPGVERAVKKAFGEAYEVRGSSWWHRIPVAPRDELASALSKKLGGEWTVGPLYGPSGRVR